MATQDVNLVLNDRVAQGIVSVIRQRRGALITL
jgi:hypothetical protein